jgi:hypothetical protein
MVEQIIRFESCSQALLFRKGEILTGLQDYVESKFHEAPVDWLIRDYMKLQKGEANFTVAYR